MSTKVTNALKEASPWFSVWIMLSICWLFAMQAAYVGLWLIYQEFQDYPSTPLRILARIAGNDGLGNWSCLGIVVTGVIVAGCWRLSKRWRTITAIKVLCVGLFCFVMCLEMAILAFLSPFKASPQPPMCP